MHAHIEEHLKPLKHVALVPFDSCHRRKFSPHNPDIALTRLDAAHTNYTVITGLQTEQDHTKYCTS